MKYFAEANTTAPLAEPRPGPASRAGAEGCGQPHPPDGLRAVARVRAKSVECRRKTRPSNDERRQAFPQVSPNLEPVTWACAGTGTAQEIKTAISAGMLLFGGCSAQARREPARGSGSRSIDDPIY